jgi:hypothetical protein
MELAPWGTLEPKVLHMERILSHPFNLFTSQHIAAYFLLLSFLLMQPMLRIWALFTKS